VAWVYGSERLRLKLHLASSGGVHHRLAPSERQDHHCVAILGGDHELLTNHIFTFNFWLTEDLPQDFGDSRTGSMYVVEIESLFVDR
jgi:hypothetical protein